MKRQIFTRASAKVLLVAAMAATSVTAIAATANATTAKAGTAEVINARSGQATTEYTEYVACHRTAHAVAEQAFTRVDRALASTSAARTTTSRFRSTPKAVMAELLGDEVDPFADPIRAQLVISAVDSALAGIDDSQPGWEATLAAEIHDISLWQIVSYVVEATSSGGNTLPPDHPCKAIADRVDDLAQQSHQAQGEYDNCLANPPPPPPSDPPLGAEDQPNEPGNGGDEGETVRPAEPCQDLWDTLRQVDLQYAAALGDFIECIEGIS